jgi:hypothetical protein
MKDDYSTTGIAEPIAPEKVVERRKTDEVSKTQKKVLIRSLNALASERDLGQFLEKLLTAITE